MEDKPRIKMPSEQEIHEVAEEIAMDIVFALEERGFTVSNKQDRERLKDELKRWAEISEMERRKRIN